MSETKNGNSATEIEAEIKRLKTEKTQAMDNDEEYERINVQLKEAKAKLKALNQDNPKPITTPTTIPTATDALPTFVFDVWSSKLDINAQRVSLTDKNLTSENLVLIVQRLKEMPNLVALTLVGNYITSIESLSELTKLESLSLGGNEISSIESLVGLINLRSLNLYGNQITSVASLVGLVNLVSLELDSNQITSIESLRGLVNLEYLNLRNNQITSIDSLDALGIERLEDEGNPLRDTRSITSGISGMDTSSRSVSRLDTSRTSELKTSSIDLEKSRNQFRNQVLYSIIDLEKRFENDLIFTTTFEGMSDSDSYLGYELETIRIIMNAKKLDTFVDIEIVWEDITIYPYGGVVYNFIDRNVYNFCTTLTFTEQIIAVLRSTAELNSMVTSWDEEKDTTFHPWTSTASLGPHARTDGTLISFDFVTLDGSGGRSRRDSEDIPFEEPPPLDDPEGSGDAETKTSLTFPTMSGFVDGAARFRPYFIETLQKFQADAINHVRRIAKTNHDGAMVALIERIRRLAYTPFILLKVLEYIRDSAPIVIHIRATNIVRFMCTGGDGKCFIYFFFYLVPTTKKKYCCLTFFPFFFIFSFFLHS